jgi:hypothetical protein
MECYCVGSTITVRKAPRRLTGGYERDGPPWRSRPLSPWRLRAVDSLVLLRIWQQMIPTLNLRTTSIVTLVVMISLETKPFCWAVSTHVCHEPCMVAKDHGLSLETIVRTVSVLCLGLSGRYTWADSHREVVAVIQCLDLRTSAYSSSPHCRKPTMRAEAQIPPAPSHTMPELLAARNCAPAYDAMIPAR